MIVVFAAEATQPQIDAVEAMVRSCGAECSHTAASGSCVLAVTGIASADAAVVARRLRSLPGVGSVYEPASPYPRLQGIGGRAIEVGSLRFGGPDWVVIAGPCSVESEEQLLGVARAVKQAGASALRGGAFKPSTSPYGFQGLGDRGLDLLAEAKRQTGLPVVTEVMDPRKVERVARVADVLQIGTRNMQNYDLLKEVGRSGCAVLLKRGMSAKVDEWLLAAEYVAREGNERILLCERGIRSFETATRNTLDLAGALVAKRRSGLPMVVDPSQASGDRSLVEPLALAALAAGADALLVEVHPRPDEAWKDGAQRLDIEGFAALMDKVRAMAPLFGRTLPTPVTA